MEKRGYMAISDLEYIEKEKEYQCTFGFFSIGWQKWNRILLIFNEKGEFIRTKSYMYNESKGKTLEETEGEHIIKAMHFKKKIQEILSYVMLLNGQEEIVFENEKYNPDVKELSILLGFGELELSYSFVSGDKRYEKIEYVFKKNGETFFINMENIPFIKGLGEKIRNHPKIRVKYVNELIC